MQATLPRQAHAPRVDFKLWSNNIFRSFEWSQCCLSILLQMQHLSCNLPPKWWTAKQTNSNCKMLSLFQFHETVFSFTKTELVKSQWAGWLEKIHSVHKETAFWSLNVTSMAVCWSNESCCQNINLADISVLLVQPWSLTTVSHASQIDYYL